MQVKVRKLEGITQKELNQLPEDTPVKTLKGTTTLKEYLERWCTKELYVCQQCKSLCTWSFGGAPDPRCDDCVAHDIQLEQLGKTKKTL